MSRTATLTRILLIRPGATEFDEQGRMKGSLDMPLSGLGSQQASSLAREVASFRIRSIFSAPCESARETAKLIADEQRTAGNETKVKVIEPFRNLDHGLWHGKLIEEVKRNHPKVYRLGAEHPEDLCPPGGESITDAKQRVTKALRKCIKRGKDGIVAFVIPDPLATLVECGLSGKELPNVWKNETDQASWSIIEAEV